MTHSKSYKRFNTISISSWNVHGLGQKHRDHDFIEYLKHDINILIETWKNDETDIKIPDYELVYTTRTKNKKAKRNSGGIVIYVKNEIKNGIQFLKNISNSPNRIWLKLNKQFFGLNEDIFICGIYIPPLNSPHYDNEYEKLENEIKQLSQNGKIILMGDLNSRTSNLPDFIINDENNEHLSEILPNDYIADFQFPRKTQDKIVNIQGRELLDLCVSAKLRILNGRFVGDILGNMTCFNKKGSSVVVYAIVSEKLLSSVKYFQVQFPTHFSDHNQLITYLNCDGKIPNHQHEYNKQEYEFKWTKLSKFLLEKELSEKYTFQAILNYNKPILKRL